MHTRLRATDQHALAECVPVYEYAPQSADEDLRKDNRDYWLELTLTECNRLDEQADPESVRAALTGPFISEGKQADEFDHDMAELLLFAMAYEACPRHYDLINDWIFGR